MVVDAVVFRQRIYTLTAGRHRALAVGMGSRRVEEYPARVLSAMLARQRPLVPE